MCDRLLVLWLVGLYDYLDDAYLDSLLYDAEGAAIADALDDIAHELQELGYTAQGEPL
jgi:hypothetical protein|tara:strand:- start:397 stop:570 length:174 start_codon:yes stop_codon:yes gene_type:complete